MANISNPLIFINILDFIFSQSGNSSENLPVVYQSECMSQFRGWYKGIISEEEWAIKMLDATAKPQAGLSYGNVIHVGNYDECLEVKHASIEGKYCSVPLHITLPQEAVSYAGFTDILQTSNMDTIVETLLNDIRIQYGFCVPAQCSTETLQEIINLADLPFHFTIDEATCDAKPKKPLSPKAIATICIFVGFGMIILISTVYDVLVYRHRSHKSDNWKTAFSAWSNMSKVLTTNKSKNNIGCLDGLRVIGLWWFVLRHEVQMWNGIPILNAAYILEWKDQIFSTLVIAMHMSVDTFFVIAGLLLVYLYMKDKDKGKKFSLIMFYIHRLFRLTPSLAMTVLFTATLFSYIGDGPFWHHASIAEEKTCQEKWWATLLYIQNYVNPSAMCVSHSWFLAVNMQLHIFAPFIMYILLKWPKTTISLMLLYLGLTTWYCYELTYNLIESPSEYDRIGGEIYFSTHLRANCYLIGMVCGYFAYNADTKSINFNTKLFEEFKKTIIVALWAITTTIVLGLIIAHSYFLKLKFESWELALFYALSKPAWSIAVAVMILLCSNGYGGTVNWILSHNIFTVLIRLNYTVYLVHIVVIMFFRYTRRSPEYFSTYTIIYSFLADYTISLIVAVVWTLSFEIPFATLEKIIFSPRMSKQKLILQDNRKSTLQEA